MKRPAWLPEPPPGDGPWRLYRGAWHAGLGLHRSVTVSDAGIYASGPLGMFEGLSTRVNLEGLLHACHAVGLTHWRARADGLPDSLTGALLSLGPDDPAVIAVLDGRATPSDIATVRDYVRRVTHRCVDVGSSPPVEMVRLERWLCRE